MLRRALVIFGVLLVIVILVEEIAIVEQGTGGIRISNEALTLLLGVVLGLVAVFFIFRRPPRGRRRRKK